MDFGEVLSKAGRIVWRFKVLWIFGIFAGCVNGSGGGSGNGMSYSQDLPYDFPNWRFDFEQALPFIIVAVLVGLLLALLLLALGAIGRIGLVRGAWQADEGVSSLSFSQLWQASGPYFWRVVGLMVLVGLLALLTVAVVALPIIGTAISVGVMGDRTGIALLPLIPLFICLACLLVPLSWLVSVLVELAVIAIVGEDVSIGEGLRRSWNLIRQKLGNLVLMAILLGLAQAVAGFLMAIPIFILGVPMMLGMFASRGGEGMVIGGAVSVVLFIILLPFLLAAGGLIQSYVTTAWTLTYRRLTGRPAAGAIVPVAEVPAP